MEGELAVLFNPSESFRFLCTFVTCTFIIFCYIYIYIYTHIEFIHTHTHTHTYTHIHGLPRELSW